MKVEVVLTDDVFNYQSLGVEILMQAFFLFLPHIPFSWYISKEEICHPFWNALFSSLHLHFNSHLFHECSLTCLTLTDSPFLSRHRPYSFFFDTNTLLFYTTF